MTDSRGEQHEPDAANAAPDAPPTDLDQGGSPRRAVILVPGLSRAARNERSGALADNLETVVQHCHLKLTAGTIDITGTSGKKLIVTNPGGDTGSSAGPKEIHIFEAFWSDLLYSVSGQRPWVKLWSGLELLVYWLIHPANWKSRPQKTKLIRGALVIGAVSLIAWYMTVAVHVASIVSTDQVDDPYTKKLTVHIAQYLPDEVVLPTMPAPEEVGATTEAEQAEATARLEKKQALLTKAAAEWKASEKKRRADQDWVSWLIEEFVIKMKSLSLHPAWGLVVLIIGFMRVDAIADTARCTKDYLLNRAEPTAKNGKDVGLRDKLRKRVVDTLLLVLDDDRYDDVLIVGHSMGAVLAMDALREWPRKEDFKRIKLATVAAPYSVFESRATDLTEDRKVLVSEESPLNWWRDYTSTADHYGAQIEGHEAVFKNQHVHVHIDTWWWQTLIGTPHNAFYRADELLTDIATQPCGPLTERYLEYTHRG